MKIEFAAISDIGPLQKNDDRVLIDGKILNMDFHEGTLETPAIAVLCDGCGGYGGGGFAAQTVLEHIREKEQEILSDTTILESVLAECQNAVVEKKKEIPEYSEMCTTLAGCIFGEDKTVFFHSGDSRVYKLNKWGLIKMTTDHSVVEEMKTMGVITEEEVRTNPSRNVITRCIGIDCAPPEINVFNAPIHSEEIFFLCSDGLWESVEDDAIKDILSESDTSVFEKAKKLVETAKKNDTKDNTSVCICIAEKTETVVDSKPPRF